MDRAGQVSQWELVDVLTAYESLERDRLIADHRHAQLVTLAGGTKDGKMPKLPDWVLTLE